MLFCLPVYRLAHHLEESQQAPLPSAPSGLRPPQATRLKGHPQRRELRPLDPLERPETVLGELAAAFLCSLSACISMGAVVSQMLLGRSAQPQFILNTAIVSHKTWLA